MEKYLDKEKHRQNIDTDLEDEVMVSKKSSKVTKDGIYTPLPSDESIEECMDLFKEIDFGEAQVSSTGSLRFNEGKTTFSHLDHRFIQGIADVMTKSANKYPKYNWTKGQDITTAYDSCLRHIFSFMSGENDDIETKMNHMFHAAANLMIMWHTQQFHPDADDRFFVEDFDEKK